jgi:hypothetical protein
VDGAERGDEVKRCGFCNEPLGPNGEHPIGGVLSCDEPAEAPSEAPGPNEVWVELSELGAPIAVWADADLAAANYSEHARAIIRYVRAR